MFSSVRFEKQMVNTGLLVADTVVKTLMALWMCLKKGLAFAARFISPLKEELARRLKGWLRKAVLKIEKLLKIAESSKKKLSERKRAIGFKGMVAMTASDIVKYDKKHKKIFRTAVNHIAPLAAVIALLTVISDIEAVDYGILLEYDGQELGIVSAESVIEGANRTLAERTTYYDIGTPFKASFTIKPLSSADETIDEHMLASLIEEKSTLAVSSPNGVVPLYSSYNGEERVRAFDVTVDGESIGAVTDFGKIDEYINALTLNYITDDVISASLEKDIEYSYERYVSPDEIVSEQYIINKFSSIETQPEYYVVEEGDNPWYLANKFGMDEDELKRCIMTYEGRRIRDMDEEFPIGAMIQLSAEVPYLQMLTTKEMTFNERVKYQVEYIDDPDMYKGESRVISQGSEGKRTVTALVTFKNDKPVSREVLERQSIYEPVTQVVRRGTRETKTAVSKGSGGGGSYFWPVGDGSGYISAYMGDGRGHTGIDIAAPRGTPVYASESGNVNRAGNKGDGYGNCVTISHDSGLVTLYGHMDSVAISAGDRVVKGQLIGYVGSTGWSTGNHLHFEVKSGAKYLNPVDYVTQN